MQGTNKKPKVTLGAMSPPEAGDQPAAVSLPPKQASEAKQASETEAMLRQQLEEQRAHIDALMAAMSQPKSQHLPAASHAPTAHHALPAAEKSSAIELTGYASEQRSVNRTSAHLALFFALSVTWLSF